MFLILCVGLALVSTIQAIVCPSNFCDTVMCAAVTAENCEGTIVKNGGFCGCCDSCTKSLAPGDSCLSTFLLGVPSTAFCPSGFYCNGGTGKCEHIIF